MKRPRAVRQRFRISYRCSTEAAILLGIVVGWAADRTAKPEASALLLSRGFLRPATWLEQQRSGPRG